MNHNKIFATVKNCFSDKSTPAAFQPKKILGYPKIFNINEISPNNQYSDFRCVETDMARSKQPHHAREIVFKRVLRKC